MHPGVPDTSPAQAGWGVQPAQPHYVTRSHAHWLLVPGGPDAAASGVNPFLSIPRAPWVAQRDLRGAERRRWCLCGQGVPSGHRCSDSMSVGHPPRAKSSCFVLPARASALNPVFAKAAQVFGDERLSEGLGCTGGQSQPGRPSPTAAVRLHKLLAGARICAGRVDVSLPASNFFFLEMCFFQPLTWGRHEAEWQAGPPGWTAAAGSPSWSHLGPWG